MNRRNFLKSCAIGFAAIASGQISTLVTPIEPRRFLYLSGTLHYNGIYEMFYDPASSAGDRTTILVRKNDNNECVVPL
jgi:hypothetical protein